MTSIPVAAVIVWSVVVANYVSVLAGRVQRAERSTQVLLLGLAPSPRVRGLAADSKRRIEAIKAFRTEAGVDVRIARAVVGSLAGNRRCGRRH